MNAVVQKNKVRTAAKRMFAGAVVGGVATFLFLEFVGEKFMDFDNPSIMLTVSTGLIYALIGLSVGFGVAAPRTGAMFLNVEDADELREQKPQLRIAAAACVLMGAFLLVLGLNASGTMLSREVAFGLLALCLAGSVILSLISRKHTDEMTRQIALEASAFTFYAALLGLAAWAALEQLGLVGWMSPLVLVSGLALIQLVAIMAVSAARGLLLR